MRKKAINQIYALVQAVEDRERVSECAPALRDADYELRKAKDQLHTALADLHSSDFRQRDAHSVR